MKRDGLTAERARALLDYDAETGVFRWRIQRGCRKAGEIAGACGLIGVDGELYLAHRVAWLYVVGRWPGGVVDHRDRDAKNNRFANLRDVPQALNTQNVAKVKRNSKTGLKGVSRQTNGSFQARIRVDGRRISLGNHATAELASAAYFAAKPAIHPGWTGGA